MTIQPGPNAAVDALNSAASAAARAAIEAMAKAQDALAKVAASTPAGRRRRISGMTA